MAADQLGVNQAKPGNAAQGVGPGKDKRPEVLVLLGRGVSPPRDSSPLPRITVKPDASILIASPATT